MLTGACDACQETATFEDHLAGTTVRCDRCGRGWVRVPPVAGITASVPNFAEKGSTRPPDTAITDRRLVIKGEPLANHRPVAGACPRCGSASFKRVKAERGTALKNDRECKECGTPYTTIPAPMSSTVRAAMYASGALLILGGAVAVLVRLAEVQVPGGRGATSFPLYVVLFSVLLGYRVLSAPQQTQQLREKRLNEHQASAPPGAPPPVELPRLPDMVSLSMIFGALALTSPLVSLLLLVVVFGPAAVVCGVVALAQGHLKGLIGMALGVVGLIVWGLVFIHFFLD
jgi:hypothetical protein